MIRILRRNLLIKKTYLTLLFIALSIYAQPKISVITTLFPIYDFTKTIAGDMAEVSFILPPAVEPHSFEPTPKDMTKIIKSDLFIYTNREMEPWVSNLIKGLKENVKIVESGHIQEEEHSECEDPKHEGHNHTIDPHIWLNPLNCLDIIDNITNGLNEIDPSKAHIFRSNAKDLKQKLLDLDGQIEKSLDSCQNRSILYAGHFAFGYFVKRYNLEYETTYHGFSPDAEPSPKKMASLIKTVKEKNAEAIFYESLTEPRLAKTIANETGAKMLLLHSCANLSRDDFNAGKSYISLMKENLKNIEEGLICQ